MTQTLSEPQTLNVEYDELMARADELEAPIPGQPVEDPHAPSALAQATGAAAQLARSGRDMRNYMAAAKQEWNVLAQSLRNAAKAYEEVDEGAAKAITDETSMVAAAPPGVTDAELDAFMVTLSETPAEIVPLPTYYPVRDAAYDIAEPDQGAAFDRFAEQWLAYQDALYAATARFRPFQYWDGDATYAVEVNMEKQRQWLFTMASLCGQMAGQARAVAAAQRWALPLHPTIEQVEKIDYYWVLYQTDPQYQADWPIYKPMMEQNYQNLQNQSEEVLAGYESQASLPLAPTAPTLPPQALKIDPPPTGGDDPDGDDPDDELPDDELPEDLVPEDELPEDEWAPSASTGTSGAPSAATPDAEQVPSDPIEQLAFPPTAATGLSTGAGVKPASFGGGGGISAGTPSMPLQPSIGPESAPRPTAPPAAAPVGAAPGTRAPMGGGMGMPMGGMSGAQNQKDNKAKRAQDTDAALYTENRTWTAAVIGNRRRNDTPDQ